MISSIIHLLIPKRCNSCTDVLGRNENEICTNCRNELPVIDPSVFTTNYIQKVFDKGTDIENFSSLFYFEKNTEVQELLHNLKYRKHQYLGKTIGDWHSSILLKNNNLKKIDLVIPIPIHKKRLYERGYNQVSLYAKTISKTLDANFEENLLLKTKHKKSQVFLSRKERFDNILDSIYLTNPNLIKGKHILLVDDLVTTGATMSACVSCLKEVECKISVTSIALVSNEG